MILLPLVFCSFIKELLKKEVKNPGSFLVNCFIICEYKNIIYYL